MTAPTGKITLQDLQERKASCGERIVAVTAYDYTQARLVDGLVDVVLVGDSLGMVVQGHSTTLPVTLDHMVYHTAAVARGLATSHLVADMPFLSYQTSPEDALRAAGRLLAEGGAQAVKLEGGGELVATVRRLVEAGIPVMGHLGLQPQRVHASGGFRLQGKTEAGRAKILEDAKKLEEAGCYALVLELVPAELARDVTASLRVPTIGIGAGPHCDGQILVGPDLLGLSGDFRPRFLKRFGELGEAARTAYRAYAKEVREGTFPGPEHSF
jgi:3-methyl-2-oxobutanoate hydroxymethyltransferase